MTASLTVREVAVDYDVLPAFIDAVDFHLTWVGLRSKYKLVITKSDSVSFDFDAFSTLMSFDSDVFRL